MVRTRTRRIAGPSCGPRVYKEVDVGCGGVHASPSGDVVVACCRTSDGNNRAETLARAAARSFENLHFTSNGNESKMAGQRNGLESGLLGALRQDSGWVFGVGTLLIVGGAGGLVTLIAGGYMVVQPVAALASITLSIAIHFLAAGILAVIASLQLRPANSWGWMLWKQWPLSGAWAVGAPFGVQLISTRASLVAIGSSVRRITKVARAWVEEALPATK